MPSEGKLGLVFGMTLVIVLAVVFFRKEIVSATASADVSNRDKSAIPAASPQGPSELRPIPAQQMWADDGDHSTATVRSEAAVSVGTEHKHDEP